MAGPPRRIEHAGWWMPATSVGWALGGVVAGILSGLMGGAVTGIGRDVGVWGFVVAAAVGILALGFLPVMLSGSSCGDRFTTLAVGYSVLPEHSSSRMPRRRRGEVGHGERDRVGPGRTTSRPPRPGLRSERLWECSMGR